jgi:hypothetical protein
MTTAGGPMARSTTRRWRAAVSAATLLGLSLVATPVALAAPPEHSPTIAPPIEFPAGDVCGDAVRFENTTLRGGDTLFAPAPDGSQRLLARGSGVSLVTNLATGATYEMQGGVQITLTFAADGSVRADAHGSDFIAYYLAGDPFELGQGLYRIKGRLTEWYDPSGALIAARYSGKVVDLCEAIGA